MGLGLPPLLVLSDRHQADRRPLVETMAAAVEGGARAVVLREKDLAPSQRLRLGTELAELLAPVGGMLMVAGPDVEMASTIGAAGVHLASADRFPAEPGELVVGRSCHGVADVLAAASEGADYATLSPVFLSASKPGYGPPLGTRGLATAARATALPVVALGGITPANARSCMAAGAAGVAVMGTVMSAEDPTSVTAAVLSAIEGSGAGTPAPASPCPEERQRCR